MKKIFALILAVMMIATMSVTAFAAETTVKEEKTETITVTGTYNADSGTPADVISLDISWGSMAFTYTAGTQEWDPATHTYKETAGTWNCDEGANKITLTNHSNIGVDVWMTFAAAEGVNVTGKLWDQYGNECAHWGMVEADSEGRLGDAAKAHTDYALFTITGGAISESSNLGTITINIEKANG